MKMGMRRSGGVHRAAIWAAAATFVGVLTGGPTIDRDGLSGSFGAGRAAAAAPAQKSAGSVGRKIENFELTDHLGGKRTLAEFSEKRLVVVAFLGVECPLAKLYAHRLSKLQREYEPRGVAFLGVDSNAQDSFTELAAFARSQSVDFPLLKDVRQAVADRFGAERTPEVFVLDADRVVRYQGRVDDQWGVGYMRDKPQREELRGALDRLLAGKAVETPRTEAVGCIIGRDRPAKSVDSSPVTYARDIAPLLAKRCVECHQEGEIAPFPLTDYEQAAGWAETIDEAVEAERMPPWHADPRHGKFADERRLTDDEKRLIREWVRAGAPRGEASERPPAPPKAVAGWQLPRAPDLVVPMSERAYRVAAEGEIKYQYFRADPKLTEDKWIAAAEVVPGNRAVVHHVLIFASQGKGDRDLDGGGTRGFLVGYVPGMRAAPYPAGMAKRLPKGSQLIFQVHYTPNGAEQSDLSKVGFVFADPKEVRREVRTVSAVTTRLNIPPGASDHVVEARSIAAPIELELLGMMPHMHVRGKAFRYEAVFPDGRRETLLDIPRYDFNWQTAYRLVEPKKLPRGASMLCTARYDNSEDNPNNPDPTQTVRWGDQTWEEMMIGYFDVAFPKW